MMRSQEIGPLPGTSYEEPASNQHNIAYNQNTNSNENDPQTGHNSQNENAPNTADTIESIPSTSGLNPNSDDNNSLKTFNPNTLPFPELLKMHERHFVFGFEFGEATKRQARENMRYSLTKAENDLKKTEGCDKNPMTPLSEHQTPHSQKRQHTDDSSELNANMDAEFSVGLRRVPEILLKHSDCVDVWSFMVHKEEAINKLRNPRLFLDFKLVTPRMRAILLDWLMEVAEVYHLRRVTYYLSVDYFDRFLSIRPDVPKSMLQLVGVTCLYIAAKLEEIYPPSLSEFSYVCDGACKDRDIVNCEVLILNSLGWEVIITTPSDWLNLFMQLHYKASTVIQSQLYLNRDLVYPQYSAFKFVKASQLIDLLSLDSQFLSYNYSLIAAAAMYYIFDREVVSYISGYTWQDLEPCVNYMQVYYRLLCDETDPRLESCITDSPADDLARESRNWQPVEQYSLQTHVATMDHFERATIIRLSDADDWLGKKKEEEEDEQEGAANDDETVDESAKKLMDDLAEFNYDPKLIFCDADQPSTSTGATDANAKCLMDDIFDLIIENEDDD